ncbi:MAG: hypothetical protein NZ561_00595, partial [Phycisphaerae bacterium]|nr:hypothetical protein [Phycisphaerae bacterium]MDW8263540.1 hypothetical protein [Phycisphaerales bacterium]
MKLVGRSIVVPALLLAFAAGCTTDRMVIAQADDVHGVLEPAVITDPELAGYIQTVGDRIIQEARQFSAAGEGPDKHFEGNNTWMFGPEMRFHLVNSPTVNAFTTGGEHMYVYTGLLQECRTEDEL